MSWDLYPQETIDPYVVDDSMEIVHDDLSNLLDKLNNESLSDDELIKYSEFIFNLDEKHPTFWTGLCKKILITLYRDRLQARL